jgi:hypothetical protein
MRERERTKVEQSKRNRDTEEKFNENEIENGRETKGK